MPQVQTNPYKTMHNPNALFCRFHPHNQLHTFCMSKECLLPMCSACMTLHNVDHCESSTYGNYIDLNELINNTFTSIEEVQRSLEELSSTYVQDYAVKNSIPQEAKAILSKTRRKAHEEIDRIFDRIDLDSMEKMSMFIDQMENQYSRIESELHQFYEVLQGKKNKLRRNNIKGANKSVFVGTGLKMGEIRQEEDEENRKADHRILKTLIEYYQGREEETNKSKLNEYNREIEKLRKVEFRVQVEFDRLGQFLKEACYGITTINSSTSNTPISKKSYPNSEHLSSQLTTNFAHNEKFQEQMQPAEEEKGPFNERWNPAKQQIFQTQTHRIEPPSFEIDQIAKNTKERLSKLNIDNKKYSTLHQDINLPTLRNGRQMPIHYDS